MLLSRDFSRFALVLSRRLTTSTRQAADAEQLQQHLDPLARLAPAEGPKPASRRPLHRMMRIERPLIEPNGETGACPLWVGWTFLPGAETVARSTDTERTRCSGQLLLVKPV